MRWPLRLHLTNLLLLLGLAALAGSFALPHVTAARVARIESRADEIVTLLAALADRPGLLDGTEESTATAGLLADARRRGQDLGHPTSWLLDPLPTPGRGDRVAFQCKHYLFLVARTPPGAATVDHVPLAARPLEVWGWPRTEDGGGRSVFQVRAGKAWFCRNLNSRYVGEERAPTPGLGQPHRAPETDWYWGTDGERWLARPE